MHRLKSPRFGTVFAAVLTLTIGVSAPAAALVIVPENTATELDLTALASEEAGSVSIVEQSSGLSIGETAFMLLGSFIFAAVLLGRKVD